MNKLLRLSLLYSIVLFVLFAINIEAQTQAEMNDEASAAFHKQDKILNDTYKEILKLYIDDTIFTKKLRIAQRAWIAYRDAYVQSVFPEDSGYGSVYPVCYYNLMQSLTEERIKELKAWLDGDEEGDVCSGSIKTKEELDEIRHGNK